MFVKPFPSQMNITWYVAILLLQVPFTSNLLKGISMFDTVLGVTEWLQVAREKSVKNVVTAINVCV